MLDFRGATIGGITRDFATKTVLPLPPLTQQRWIADLLDKSEALRTMRRAAISQLDDFTQSIFLDSFGDPMINSKDWPRIPFGELLSKIDSGWSPRCLDRPISGDEWGVLKLGAVTRCEYNPVENKALPPDVAPRPDLEVKAGDLLFARKNTYELVAACALVRDTPPQLQLPDLIFRLRLDSDAAVDVYESHRSQAARLPQEVAAVRHPHLPAHLLVDREGVPAAVGRHPAHRRSNDAISAHFVGSIVYIEKGLYQVTSQSPCW